MPEPYYCKRCKKKLGVLASGTTKHPEGVEYFCRKCSDALLVLEATFKQTKDDLKSDWGIDMPDFMKGLF